MSFRFTVMALSFVVGLAAWLAVAAAVRRGRLSELGADEADAPDDESRAG